MNELNEPVPESEIIHSLEEAENLSSESVSPSLSARHTRLGGTGGGICSNEDELKEIVENGLKMSPVHQCLLEKSIAGYKEIEYEVMRDIERPCASSFAIWKTSIRSGFILGTASLSRRAKR